MKSTVAGLAYRFLPAAGLLTIGLIIGTSGCQKKAPPAADTAAPAKATATATSATDSKKEDKVVVTVNGTVIKESQVQQLLDLQYKPILARYAAQSPQLAAQQEKIFREGVTKNLVTRQLLEEQAKAAGIQVTEEELTAEMTKQLAAQKMPMTIEQYQKAVTDQGGDFEAMKALLRQGLRFHKLFETKFAANVGATEADAKKYYDENAKEFQMPEQVQASHILISSRPTEPNADPNKVKVQAKQKAEGLLKKIKEGADFATLAKENSDDTGSKVQGGDLGLFPRGPMVKPFEDAAFSLKIGEVSGLVETQFGYHIIKVTGHQDPNQVSFDKAKAQILEQLSQQKRQEAADKYIESLRAGAKIVYVATPDAPAPQPARPQIIPMPADANSKK
jgi:peptidyl-prolyl cis-trans isomerase C